MSSGPFKLDENQISGPTHDGRQVDDDERRLYDRARQVQRDRPEGCAVRLEPVARGLGIHEQRARDLARRWANEGRWMRLSAPGSGRFTDDGMTTELDQ